MMTDPIADMLTRIRNAQMANHTTLRMPASRMRLRIAEILVQEGYLSAVDDLQGERHPTLEMTLRYVENQPVIQHLRRESRPGQRVYVKSDEIPRVLGGLGLTIVSTSKGVMAGRDARKARVGGELLCTIY